MCINKQIRLCLKHLQLRFRKLFYRRLPPNFFQPVFRRFDFFDNLTKTSFCITWSFWKPGKIPGTRDLGTHLFKIDVLLLLKLFICTLLLLQIKQIKSEKQHNVCEADFAKNDIAVRLAKLKTKISDPEAPAIFTAYNSAVSSLKDTGIDVIREFPRLKNIKATLYNHRNAALGVNKTQFQDVAEVQSYTRIFC